MRNLIFPLPIRNSVLQNHKSLHTLFLKYNNILLAVVVFWDFFFFQIEEQLGQSIVWSSYTGLIPMGSVTF